MATADKYSTKRSKKEIVQPKTYVRIIPSNSTLVDGCKNLNQGRSQIKINSVYRVRRDGKVEGSVISKVSPSKEATNSSSTIDRVCIETPVEETLIVLKGIPIQLDCNIEFRGVHVVCY